MFLEYPSKYFKYLCLRQRDLFPRGTTWLENVFLTSQSELPLYKRIHSVIVCSVGTVCVLLRVASKVRDLYTRKQLLSRSDLPSKKKVKLWGHKSLSLICIEGRIQDDFWGVGFDLIKLTCLLYVFGKTGLSKQWRPRSDVSQIYQIIKNFPWKNESLSQ